MDSESTLDDLKDEVEDFCEARDWGQYHDGKELSIALSTETSELLEHFRYKTGDEIEETMSEKREEIEDEMADVMFLLLRMAQIYDIDLSESFENKVEKIERKYPVEKSRGSNKKYTEFE